MTLQNLLAIQSLIEFIAQREDIQRLLSAAERNLKDATVTTISDENRFDAAYKCIMSLTVGLDPKTVVVLDKLRKQRNISDYDAPPSHPVR